MTKPSAFERAAEIRELDLVDVDKAEEQLGASASRPSANVSRLSRAGRQQDAATMGTEPPA